MRAVLIGAGGHAKVVFEALIAAGHDRAAITLRADQELEFIGRPVATPECLPDMSGTCCHVAIGNNAVRAVLLSRVTEAGGGLLKVLHPRAHVSPSAVVGGATLVAAGAVVGPEARLGTGVIVNHGALIDHDCRVGDFTHIAPGAVLGGAVRVGRAVLIGSNATVLPGLEIGDNVVVGAGSVVTKDISCGQVWVGTTILAKEQ